MNTKTYQKITNITVPAGQTVGSQFISGVLSMKDTLRSDFEFATGIFFYSEQSISSITCGVKIDGNEILPQGTDATLFRWTEGISREEALWKFYEERQKSSSKTIELNFSNNSSSSITLEVYVLLENEQK